MSPQYITLKGRAVDISNMEFGRLTALGPTGRGNDGGILWHCRCICGKETIVTGAHLRSGHTTSCGCYQSDITTERSTSHGMSRTKEYQVWCSMNERCRNPNNRHYRDYGGRGIVVCEEWKEDFVVFHDYMGDLPFKGATVDRINNELGYFPGNVKWSTQTEQARNRRNNTMLTYNGKTQSMSAWAEEAGMGHSTIQTRMKLGWPIDKVLTEPVDNEPRLITYDGRTQRVAAWAREMGIDRAAIRSRLELGWDIDRAFTQPVKKRQ